MPGAWELRQSASVLCAILHVDQTTMPWSLGFRNLQIPGGILPLAGMPYDMGRNMACQAVLNGEFQWLFFLDSDVIPPADTIHRLIKHGLPIASGVYHRRSPPAGIPVMMKPVGQWVASYPANSLIEVDVVGAGCLLIHRSVIEKLRDNPDPKRPGKLWFDWRVDMRGHAPDLECLSEDFSFCMRAKQLGFKTMVDTSIQCRHVGLAEATFGKFEPVTCVPVC